MTHAAILDARSLGAEDASPPNASEIAKERIPADIASALSKEQLLRLSQILAPYNAHHSIRYQISSALFGERFYLAVLAGPERRSQARIQKEGQHRTFRALALRVALIVSIISACVAVSLVNAISVGYLVKTGLGIDIIGGDSFLHACFFN